MKKIVFLIAFLGTLLCAQAQYRTEIVMPSMIKTLRTQYWSVTDAAPLTDKLVRPYLVLGSNGIIDENGDAYNRVLEISWDEMSHETHQYTYSLLHLNADYTPSALSSFEYVDGFTKDEVIDYEHSLNTSRLYTHYRFTFPQENMRIKVSGNYAIKIYEDNDEEKVIAYVCFSVVEPIVGIKPQLRSNTDIEITGRYQQLDMELILPSNCRSEDYFICVRQNNRRDNEVFKPKPTYMGSQRQRYLNCKELIFEGGNEYRHFDSFSAYFAGAHVDRITHDHVDYHATLEPDALWGMGAQYMGETVTDVCGTPYMHEYDVNGQFKINAEKTLENIETEAEYMWVHWTLAAAQPWLDGLVYVGGDLFQNILGFQNRMQYDNDKRCYYLDALVKQGGHDYQYWFVKSGEQKATLQRTEGSHWETGNEYTIYVYYRPFGGRYDQLVGITVLQ